MHAIDLNCDMGESFGIWRMGDDAAVMPWISSANIACGFHAGDPLTLMETVRSATAHGVAVGAHVGLPDLVGFGRRAMAVTPAELHAMTVVQLGALAAAGRAAGTDVVHLKPHGALYHMVEQRPELARAVVDAVLAVDPRLRVVGLAGGTLVATAAATGLAVGNEAFVDRRYAADGGLLPRGEAGAVLETPAEAVRQAIGLARDGQATAVDGRCLVVHADTLCVHGDRPDAGAFAQALHEGLLQAGVAVRRMGD